MIRLFFFLMMSCVINTVYAQVKHALVVGLSEYQKNKEDSWATIHGANDAELITPILKQQGFKTTMICNKSATAKRIRKEIHNLMASCKNGDVVYLHFSCHGQPFEDQDGDEEDGWDESIVPYDALMTYQKGKYEGDNHITDDELHTYFQKLRSALGPYGFVYVVIDACHSGGSSRGEDLSEEDDELFERGTRIGFSPLGTDFRPRINSKGNFQIPEDSGSSDILILEACRSYQSNYEIKQDGKYYGPLTYYVSQVLLRQPLSASIGWVQEVRQLMSADKRLVRQNMVYETSLK